MIVVTHRTPVKKGGEAELERSFHGRLNLMEMTRGFIRNEFLKPLNADTYILLSYWETRDDYEAWRNSAAGKRAFPAQNSGGRSSASDVPEIHEVIGISERIMAQED